MTQSGASPAPPTPELPPSVARQMLRGTGWVAVSNLVVQVLSMIQLFVVGRFLTPSQFGLLEIALQVILTLETFTASVFTQALTQRQGNIDGFLNSVLIANVLRGFTLTIVTVLAAPLAARLFHDPDATAVIRVAGTIILIRAFTNPALAQVSRALRFRGITLASSAGR